MRVTELLPLVLLALAFWLLIIRPVQRQRAAKAALMQALQPGAEVVTTGGMHGTVVAIVGEDIVLEVAPGVRLRFVRGAVAAIKPSPDADTGAASGEPDEGPERSEKGDTDEPT